MFHRNKMKNAIVFQKYMGNVGQLPVIVKIK